MKTSRYASSRQKSCRQCSLAKAKCDRSARGCARCARKGLGCHYHLQTNNAVVVGASSQPRQAATTETQPLPRPPIPLRQDQLEDAPMDFGGLQLVCPIQADDIQNRWLNSYVPVPGQKPKNYPENVTRFLFRILKSYAAIAVRGREPPFVHPFTVEDTPTAGPMLHCLSSAYYLDHNSDRSAEAVEGFKRDMAEIVEQYQTYDEMTLLSAFQACLIYCMVIFFWRGDESKVFLREFMMSLQEMACSMARHGLICTEEQRQPQAEAPRWESWIAAESKRRALYVMYLFDSLQASLDGLSTFLGVELEGLLAPAPKKLWAATTRREWAVHYLSYRDFEWPHRDPGLTIDELWPKPDGTDDDGVAARRERTDRWLEYVDEFGTMLFTVTSMTHEN